MYRAPVDVVTGFLGSGKTTLLRRLLAAPAGRRVAVVVNELAGIDVDGRVLGGLRLVDRALEVAGGCLCCEIEESRLAAGIAEILERARPDLVVVETSGAADPAAATDRLRAAGLVLDAVIVMVDAEHGRDTLERHDVARAQVAAADFAVLNRIDLAAPGEADALEERVARLSGRALVRRAVRADADLDLLFATGAARMRAAAAHPPAAASSIAPAAGRRHGIDARVHRTGHPVDRARLERVLGALPEGVHRAKGIARVADAGLGLLFNVVRRRVELEWLPFAARDTQAVFIGEGLDRSWPGIAAALSACEQRDAGPPGLRAAGGGGRVA